MVKVVDGRLENGLESSARCISSLVSALTSFIGILIADPGTWFPCTPRRSHCHHPEVWVLKHQPSGGSPVCLHLAVISPDGCARPCFVLMVSSFTFYPDEQQKVEQLPASHPAGEPEAVQQGAAGGDGAEPFAEAHPARCI